MMKTMKSIYKVIAITLISMIITVEAFTWSSLSIPFSSSSSSSSKLSFSSWFHQNHYKLKKQRDGIPPNVPPNTFHNFLDDDDDNNNLMASSFFLFLEEDTNNEFENTTTSENNDWINSYHDHDDDYDYGEDTNANYISTLKSIRGGSSKTSNENIRKGMQTSLSSTAHFWSDTFQSFQSSISSSMNKLRTNILGNKNNEEDEDSMIDPTTVIIQRVTVPDSAVLPPDIIQIAAKRSGLIGSTLQPDKVNEFARHIKRWYIQNGFVLNSITKATLNVDDSTASLSVQEPIIHHTPIAIRFAKQVPIDPETGTITDYRKYRQKIETLRKFNPSAYGIGGSTSGRLSQNDWLKIKSQLNTTLIETNGRTNAITLSKRLGLQSGHPFQWHRNRWEKILSSGIFAQVYRASPARMQDGTVQLQVLAQEPPPRNLEYGISKSLYTGSWEGELDFSHGNLLGGGETLGLIVRRGAKDPEPSVKLRFTDDKFGMAGGYDVEAFNDYIAVEEDGSEVNKENELVDEKGGGDADTMSPPASIVKYDEDQLLCRKGLTFRLRNPLPQKVLSQSSASACLERTSTRTGKHESIGSVSMDVGPIRRDLPLGARTNLLTSITNGFRITDDLTPSTGDSMTSSTSWSLLPYSSVSATTRQIFPFFTESYSTPNNREVSIALQHSIMSSTRNLPRHEANAAGFAARVRGYSTSSNGPVSTSAVGSVEVRVPVTIPFAQNKLVQDASMVMFTDWMVALKNKPGESGTIRGLKDWRSNGFRKSSIGVGLRKSIQGIPVKYDVSVTADGKIGAFFGLGKDWDV